MKKINDSEMILIKGGGSSSISGTLISALYKTLETIYSIGEAFGSYIRRKVEGNICKL